MMQTVPARWYRQGRTARPRLIVIHCTVSGESGTGAEAVANYFARGERKASAHRTCDSNSTVISVADGDTAFAAAGANHDGLHLELVGMPDQTPAQWADPFSTAMIAQGGITVREWSDKYDIPLRWLTVAEVADGVTRGLCTHHDVSRAFPNVSTGHWDPGPNFPKTEALRVWSQSTDIEDDMADYAGQLNNIELRLIALQKTVDILADDVPDNLAAQLAEVRKNLRTDLQLDGATPEQIIR